MISPIHWAAFWLSRRRQQGSDAEHHEHRMGITAEKNVYGPAPFTAAGCRILGVVSPEAAEKTCLEPVPLRPQPLTTDQPTDGG